MSHLSLAPADGFGLLFAQGYCCYLLFQQEPPHTHRGEQSPRIPEVSIDAEGTERNVKEMTSAVRSSSFPPLPSPSDSRSRGWFVNEELKLIQTERKTDKGCLQAEVSHEKVAVLRRGLNSK